MLCLCLGNNVIKHQYVRPILRTLYVSCRKQQQQQPERRSKPFPVLDGNVDATNKDFLKNFEVSKSYEAKYGEIIRKSQLGGGEKAIARHVKQHKKLLAEDRVKLLVDDYNEFFELSPIAGHAMEYGDVARAGILGGIV